MPATAGSSQPADQLSPQAAKIDVGSSDNVVRAMTAALERLRPASTAEALRVLRRRYPDIPLALRIAAMRADAK